MSGHIFLIGFMGSGKSTVAALLAERTGRPRVDLDSEIEAGSRMSVRQIFETVGESVFRDKESRALAAVAQREPSIVACGGGIVLRPENRRILAESGTVVYLEVTAGEAIARIGDAQSRPLLSGPGAPLAATKLLSARESLYRSAADVCVDTVGRSADEIADTIIGALEERGAL